VSIVIADLLLSAVALVAWLAFLRPGWGNLQAKRLGTQEPIDQR
jgi:hypothetical protein